MKDIKDFVVWKDIPVLIKIKGQHIKKIGGKVFNSFHLDFGDLPIFRINPTTGKPEEVVNNRGKAYAARKRQKYRKRKRNV